MTDRLIATPSPSVLLVVSTDNAVPLIHLHLESRRRFSPDVPMIVHDTGGASQGPMQDLCAAYGAHFFSPTESVGPHGADISAALLAVQAAQEMGLELAVLMSDACVPLTNWVPQLQHLASQTQYAAYGGLGLCPKCVALHAPTWAAGDIPQRLERAAEAGLPSPAAAVEFLRGLAREVQRAAPCAANAAYERLYPPAPGADGHGLWPWLGTDGSRPQPSLLRRGADAPLDFHRLALAYGLDYHYRDYEAVIPAPAVSAPAVPTPAAAAPALPASVSAPRRAARMHTAAYEARVVSHDIGDFKAITDANVLMYFPHGFGDWVQFAAVLPLLEPSNRYFMARFGDDSTSLMEGSAFATPLYCGYNSPHCEDGGLFGNRHFGLNYEEIDGSVKVLDLPLPLRDACRRSGIDVVFWSSLPETWGMQAYPYHTKARLQLLSLVAEERLAALDLASPMGSALNFDSAPWLARWVEARLAAFGGYGDRRLCLITRNGYTSIGKNWGHWFRDEVPGPPLPEGQECRDFMRLMRKKDPRWMFLVMEDRLYDGDDTVRSEELHAYSYAELFGAVGGDTPPFGLVMKALVGLADLAVGVPAGSQHLCMAKPGLPTVGLWIDHLPSWYDEPKPESIHLVSRHVHDQGQDARPGSFTDRAGLHYRTVALDTLRIPGEDVFRAAEELLS